MGSPIKKHKYTSGLNVKCWTRLPWIWAQLDVLWRCDNDAASKVCNDDGIAWLRYVFKLNVIYLRNFKKIIDKNIINVHRRHTEIETNHVDIKKITVDIQINNTARPGAKFAEAMLGTKGWMQ